MNTIYWSAGQDTGTAPIRSYPSGEPLIDFPRSLAVQRLLLKPESLSDLMAGLFFVDALVERGHAPPSLILPFVPGARQDRLNDTGDYLFTAKSVAKEINARGFPSVTVLDPHSEVISALIDRCKIIHAHECLAEGMRYLESYSAIVSPDAGAEKRAGAVARKLGVPLLHAWKTRDVTTGEITGFGLEPTEHLTGGRVLIVDDICDGGGTFIGLASILKMRLLKADLYVTHGLFSQGTSGLRSCYFKLITTDSIHTQREGADVIPVSEQLLKGAV